MKFKIIETPAADKENEGKTLSLEEAAKFLGLDAQDMEERSIMAEAMMFKGYKLEILCKEEETEIDDDNV